MSGKQFTPNKEKLKREETCPECNLFLWACRCKEPVENRLPTDREIRKYLNTEILGFRAKDEFVTGFRAGWAARKDHLPDFLKAQTVSSENKQELKP